MTVNITWSSTSGGAAISSPLDHGSATNGASTTYETIYLRHDGSNAITNASLYFRQISGTYTGSTSASADYSEILAWGNETTTDDFGGAFISWNATSWPTVSTKAGTYHFTLSNGYGNGEVNAVILPTVITGISTAGTIPISTNICFYIKFQVPTNEDTVGIRQIESVLAYTYTS